MCKFDLDYVSEVWGSLESDCRHRLCWLFNSKSEDCAKHVVVQAGLPVSDSVEAFWEVTPVDRVKLKTYRTDH